MLNNAKKRLESRMLGNLQVRFGVGVGVQFPGLHYENHDLKKAVAELHLEVQRYKKSLGM